MGNGASRNSIEEISTPTSTETSQHSHQGSMYTAVKKPEKHQPNETVKREPENKIQKQSDVSSNMSDKNKKSKLSAGRDEDFVPDAKSVSDSDDEAFSKFCIEIDAVLEGHSSVVEMSQRRKSSVSSTEYSGTSRAEIPPAAPSRKEEYPNQRRFSGPLKPQGTFPVRQHQEGYQTAGKSPGHPQFFPHPPQAAQQHVQHLQHHQQQHTQHQQHDRHHSTKYETLNNRPVHPRSTSGPPPLVKKTLSKPSSPLPH